MLRWKNYRESKEMIFIKVRIPLLGVVVIGRSRKEPGNTGSKYMDIVL